MQPVATLSEIEASEIERTPTGLAELDRALGGGIVEGGVVLIGGDPGIGKSTLLLQAAERLAQSMPVLYVTGEESGAQVALRARRLGLREAPVRVLAEIQLETHPGGDRSRAAEVLRHRLDPDRVLRRADLGARLGGAGARMRRATDARGQDAAARPSCWSAT